jgi:hypothetical protein
VNQRRQLEDIEEEKEVNSECESEINLEINPSSKKFIMERPQVEDELV